MPTDSIDSHLDERKQEKKEKDKALETVRSLYEIIGDKLLSATKQEDFPAITLDQFRSMLSDAIILPPADWDKSGPKLKEHAGIISDPEGINIKFIIDDTEVLDLHEPIITSEGVAVIAQVIMQIEKYEITKNLSGSFTISMKTDGTNNSVHLQAYYNWGNPIATHVSMSFTMSKEHIKTEA